MEREAVLHWLQDVHAATHDLEESNEGFFDPDKSSSSTYSGQSFQQTHHPQLTTTTGNGQFSPSPTLSGAAGKRAAFKLTRGHTVSSGDPFKYDTNIRQPLLTTIPANVPEHTTKCHQISPLPFSNKDFVLPTINLTETEVPERKPLMKQSSTEFLTLLKTKASRQHKLLQSSKFRSVDLPAHAKSAPSSPHWLRKPHQTIVGSDLIFSQWDMDKCGVAAAASPEPCGEQSKLDTSWELPGEQVASGNASFELRDEQGAAAGGGNSGTGSCVAEQGQLSDVALSGDDMEIHSDEGITAVSAELEGEMADSKSSGPALQEILPCEKQELGKDDISSGLEGGCDCYTDPQKAESKCLLEHVDRLEFGEASSTPCFLSSPTTRQVPTEITPSSVEVESPSTAALTNSSLAHQMQVQSNDYEDNKIKAVKLSPYLYKRHRSYSQTHIQLLSKANDSPSAQCPAPTPQCPAPTSTSGTNSLTFHDHHLGRAATHKLVRSPTLDESSRSGVAISKLGSHSPLLQRKMASGPLQDKNGPPNTLTLLFGRLAGESHNGKPSTNISQLLKSTTGNQQ